MTIFNFNFHDILKVRFERSRHRSILEDLDLKFNYFRMNELIEPDVTVKIGPFEPVLDGCKVYERRFFVRDGFIYGEGGGLRSKWAVQIDGLNKDKLSVNINARCISVRGLLAPNLLVDILLLPLLELRFFEKGYLLLHSAAVSRDGMGILIAGRGSSFKTSITMDLIRKYGYEYMGDERALIGSNTVLSFPTHIQIFEFLLKNAKSELMNMYTKSRLFMYLLNRTKREKRVVDRSSLVGLLFLMPSTKPFVERKIDEKVAAKKMICNMLMENFEALKVAGLNFSPIFECIITYTSAYPNSPLAKFQERLLLQLERIFSKLPIYEVSIPLEYDESISHFINVMLNRILNQD